MKNRTIPKKTVKPLIKKTSSLKAETKRSTKKASEPTATVRFGIHSLKPPKGAHMAKRILGRGPSSGHGKTSTRGSKGQTSRSGRDFYLGFEGGQSPLIRRFPKRGFASIFKKEFQLVNLKDLVRIKGLTEITPQILEEHGLIKNRDKAVKILGSGEVTVALKIKATAFSKSAQDKIKNAGGTCEVIRNV